MTNVTLHFSSVHFLYFLTMLGVCFIPYAWFAQQRLRVTYGLLTLLLLSLGGAFTIFRKTPLDGTLPYEIVLISLYLITMLIPTRKFPLDTTEPHRGNFFTLLGQWLLYMCGFYSGVGYNFSIGLN